MQKSKIDLQQDSKIQLGDNFEKKLGLIHIKIERLRKKRISTYIYFGVFMGVGALLILSQKDLFRGFNFTYSRYLIFARSLLVVFLGFVLCRTAFYHLKKYRKEQKNVTEEKEKINKILNQYNIKYSYNIKFGRKYHGIQDVIVEIKSNSKLLKNSKITHQI